MSGSWLKCNVKQNILTCNDLLHNTSVSCLCFFVGILALMLNSISIVFHIKFYSQLQGNKFFTLSLSLTDCLYGMYLLTINSANWYYRGYYAGAEFTWTKSFACQASSFITLFSFIASPLILFVMMLARFYVIQWPITSKFKCEKHIEKITSSIIFITAICCLIMIVTFICILGQHVLTGMCILLYTNGQLSEFILVTSLTVICVQIFCLISNMTVNMFSVWILITKMNSIIPHCTKNENYKQIVINLFVVIFINMCSWIPSSVVFILPLIGYQISDYLFTWVFIAVVPLNYVVNPVLFSIVTPTMKRWFSSTWSSFIRP